MAQPAPPRKGTYSKHVQALNKDQLQRLQSKNSHEIELLEDIRMFNKQKAAMEKTYAEGMIKLTTQYLGKRNQPVPDIQKQEENAAEVNVYTLWRRVLEEYEKSSRTRLSANQVFHDEVEKSAKAARKEKEAKTKVAFQRLVLAQKDLQQTISELDRTKRIYFHEETDAEDVRDKAKSAEERSKGKKKDMMSLFKSQTTLKKTAGKLSAKQEEMDIRSTGARNDYILNLASSNAHQERYYKHDLQDTMLHLEGDFYERISTYLGTISKTEVQALSGSQASFAQIKELSAAISRLYNYECYTTAYPSLGQHIQYEHEAPAADNIRTITPSEHDGGYSLNYEARQNASKLNQSVKTIKAYKQRIKACHFHKSKGLKHEPNDAGGPDLDTKIVELELAIRQAETDRAKAEARLERLREGGISVDEYIDSFVYSYDASEKAEERMAAMKRQQSMQKQPSEPTQPDWGSESDKAEQEEPNLETPAATETAAANGGWADSGGGGGWADQGWGDSDQTATAVPAEEENAAPGNDWANFGNQETPAAGEVPGGDTAAATDWAQSGGWGTSVDRQNSVQASDAPAAAPSESRTSTALVLYDFDGQNEDELTVRENEAITVLLDECDEEGWIMGLNSEGKKGFVPANYVQQDGEQQQAGGETATDQAATEQQQQYDYSTTTTYGQQDSYTYGRQDSYGLVQDSYGGMQYGAASNDFQRQDSVLSQGSVQRQSSVSSQGSFGGAALGPAGMAPIPEQAEATATPAFAPPPVPPPPTVPVTAVEDSSSEEEEEDSSAEESSIMPPGLPPPPGPPPPPLNRDESVASEKKLSRPPSISLSQSLADCKDFCRALYDYDATGSDEISFEEGDSIRILKRCPNGVDDGWWMGELNGKIGLFPSIVVEEISDNDASPADASSMTSPPSMAPPSMSALPPPPPPPPREEEDSSNSSSSEAADEDEPEESSASKPIEVVKEKQEEEKSEKVMTMDTLGKSKPGVPCVQVSVDEVPDIPRDPTEDDNSSVALSTSSSEAPVVAVAVSQTTKSVPDEGPRLSLDDIGIVVTAPTPTIQSPESEGPPPPPPPAQEEKKEEGKEQPEVSVGEPPAEKKTEDTKSEEMPPPPPIMVVVDEDTPESPEEAEPTSTTPAKAVEGDQDEEEEDSLPPPPPPAEVSSGASPISGTTDDDDDIPKRVIERRSSSEDEDNSSSSAGPIRRPRRRSSSGSESAGGPDSDVTEASEAPQPPEQLELRQLKKLDSMKESTA